MAGDALNDPNYAARLKLSEDPEKAKERAGMASDMTYQDLAIKKSQWQ